ncbi:MAG: putative zinc-binding protein [Anaerolineaceae bacterium]|nr:putative zinc-binding protein [Anaerolineaceae bacterium]
MTIQKKVVIVPCSGIGKSYGTVSRYAAYQVTDEDRPLDTSLLPLSLLVMGDEQTRQQVSSCQSITIDGCKLACATKMVQECGGKVAQEFAVLEVYRRYREFKPQGIAELNEGGEKLAQALAVEIDQVVDELTGKGGQNA